MGAMTSRSKRLFHSLRRFPSPCMSSPNQISLLQQRQQQTKMTGRFRDQFTERGEAGTSPGQAARGSVRGQARPATLKPGPETGCSPTA